jgi:flavin-dependent dehydrogenase
MTGEIRAPLVAGADGRRSTVARLTGATKPHRASPNGRACVFAYVEERRPDRRHVAAQWRAGPELGTAFPCDGGLVLVLLMPPVHRAAAFRADLPGEFARTVERLPGLAERLAGGEPHGKVRSATDLPSYFRRSAGPGWALPGDAGHFKDPVTAQGIRDALRFGRLLGEAAAPTLRDPSALDHALAAWERRREDECLETYQWTNQLARAEAMTPLEVELYRTLARHPKRTADMLDVFSRARRPSEVLTVPLALRLTARALARPGADHREVARIAARDLGTAVADRRERMHAARPDRHPVEHARPLSPRPPLGADGRLGAGLRAGAAGRGRV